MCADESQVYMGARGQLILVVFFKCSPPYILIQNLSLDPRRVDSARLGSRHGSGMPYHCLSCAGITSGPPMLAQHFCVCVTDPESVPHAFVACFSPSVLFHCSLHSPSEIGYCHVVQASLELTTLLPFSSRC